MYTCPFTLQPHKISLFGEGFEDNLIRVEVSAAKPVQKQESENVAHVGNKEMAFLYPTQPPQWFQGWVKDEGFKVNVKDVQIGIVSQEFPQ